MIIGTNICLNLAGQRILNGVSLTLEPGLVTVLCGPNGAGKSTLLACLAGEHRQANQDVRYAAGWLCDLPAHVQARHRVVLEQSPSLAAEFTVSELLELGVPLNLSTNALNRLKRNVLEELELESRTSDLVSTLSGGQRHRAHLARVLTVLNANRRLGHECFLFLDEPTASLDIRHQLLVLQKAKALSQEGVGVLVVLHDLNLAAAFGDKVLLMKAGEITHDGQANEVLTASVLSDVYETPILVNESPDGQVAIQPRL